MARYLYSELASALAAYKNCIAAKNTEWRDKHLVRVKALCSSYLPSGSGWDQGTNIDLDVSHAEKLVLFGSFHHMNDCGMYDGWTDHTITVTPSFDGINLRISGRNRNDIKEYLHELFHSSLSIDLEEQIQREQKQARNKRQLQRLFKFFLDNAGMRVGFHAVDALALARAAMWSDETECTYEWSDDPDGDLGDHEYWCSDARRIQAGYNTDGEYVGTRRLERCTHESYCCSILNSNGEVLGSLGGILEPSDDYRKVIEAELALEAMPE